MDMFYINDFLRYCANEYPFLKISIKFNACGLYYALQIRKKGEYKWYFADFSAEDEKDAIKKIEEANA